MRYPIVLYTSNGSGNYGVTVPDIPGCFSAGETRSGFIAQAAVRHASAQLEENLAD